MRRMTIEQYFQELDRVRISYQALDFASLVSIRPFLKEDFKPLLHLNYKHDTSNETRSSEVVERVSGFGQLECTYDDADPVDWYLALKDDPNLKELMQDFGFSGESITIDRDTYLLNMSFDKNISPDFDEVNDDYELRQESILGESVQNEKGEQIWLSVLGKREPNGSFKTNCQANFLNSFFGLRFGETVFDIDKGNIEKLAGFLGLSLPLTTRLSKKIRVEIRVMRVLEPISVFRPTVFSHGMSDRYCSRSWYAPFGNATKMESKVSDGSPASPGAVVPEVIGLTEIVAKRSELRGSVLMDEELSFHRYYPDPLGFMMSVNENRLMECLSR